MTATGWLPVTALLFTSYHERSRKSIETQEKPKRKTHTSNEVKKRYNDKTYQQYALKLRKLEDADLIARIEAEKAKGFGTTEAIKRLLK